jgi:hypothetical protein
MTRRRRIIALLLAGLLVLAGPGAFWFISRDEAPPPDDSDLALAPRPEVPDDQNGMTCFRQAGEVVYWPKWVARPKSPPRVKAGETSGDVRGAADEMPLSDQEQAEAMLSGGRWTPTLAADILKRNAEALALFEKGLACPHCQAPRDWAPGSTFVNLSPLIDVGRVATLKAMALAHQGDGDAALRQAMDVVEYGRDVQQSEGRLISVLGGSVITDRGTAATRYILAKAPLSADVLKAQAARLDQYADCSAAYADSSRLSYQWFKAVIEKEVKPNLSGGRRMAGGIIFRENETMRVAAAERRTVISQIDRPMAEFQKPELPWPEKRGTVARILGGNVLGRGICELGRESSDIIIQGKCDGRTDARITQVLMALRLFRMKTGRLPEALDELVPDYLAAVPLDDFDGKPIRYSLAKKIVYTVGKDLKDDGGLSREEARALWQKQNPRVALREDEEVIPLVMPDPSYDIQF